MDKKVLLVSISFPPKNDPESLQVGRYVKYLIKMGCNLDAITSSNPTLYMETDKNLESLSNGVNIIYEIKLFENRYINFFIRKLRPSLLEYPDSKFSFHLRVPRVEKPDILYSRSYPLSSTILALKIKKQWPDIPWLLHLSDPWAVSYKGNSPATNFRKSSRKWNKEKEQECFRLASKISFTSQKTIQLYKEEYPQYADKYILTPNVYDDDNLNCKEVQFDDKFNIVYTGGFGEKRDPKFFLKAIKQFLIENTQLKDKINFVFTGPMTNHNRGIFDNYSEVKEITHLGMIDYQEMLNLQSNAHVLVNIDTNIEDAKHSVFFPSKLLEYFAANRRVLAITNTHSVTYDVVEGKFGDCVDFNEYDKLTSLFAKYYKRFISKDSAFFTLDRDIDEYAAYANSTKLLEELHSCI